MSKNVFYVSDMHFGHTNICKFECVNTGKKIRPWTDVEEMDEDMVDNWNKVVAEFDRVYVLGDVVINRKHLKTLGRLKGKKVLIRGNHDIFDLAEYTPYFEDVRGYKVTKEFICSHIPLHPESLSRWPTNVHGHLHQRRVRNEMGEIDPRYFSVCVEQIDYVPIEYREMCKRIAKESS